MVRVVYNSLPEQLVYNGLTMSAGKRSALLPLFPVPKHSTLYMRTLGYFNKHT